MATVIKTLRDWIGNQIIPRTRTLAVFDDNNVDLKTALENNSGLNTTDKSMVGAINELELNKAEQSSLDVTNELVDEIKSSFEKANLILTNLISNGNFGNGVTGWNTTNSTLSTLDNILSVTGNGVGVYVRAISTSFNFKLGRKYYISGKARVTNPICNVIAIQGFDVSSTDINNPVANQWYSISIKASPTIEGIFSIDHRYQDSTTANGKVMEIKDIICLDLTSIYGAGNEPTSKQMDEIMKYYPKRLWFNLDDKANKKQEPWITATLQNGWTGLLQYAKNDLGIVTVKYSITSGTITPLTTIATLPQYYRPLVQIAFPIMATASGNAKDLNLTIRDYDGVLRISTDTVLSASVLYSGQISYYAN